MLKLNISQQYAKLELTSQRAKLNMKTIAPRVEIDTEPAKVEIRQPMGKLEIDQSPCRASYGIKSPTDFSREIAEEGKRAALEAIARIAQEGQRMASIESKEDAIVAMATETNFPPPPQVVLARTASPNIRYTASPVEFQVTQGRVNINPQLGSIQTDYQPGTVQGHITQYQSVRMWTTENKYDLYA